MGWTEANKQNSGRLYVGRTCFLQTPKCPMALEYLPRFARTKSPSYAGKYTIHGAYGTCILKTTRLLVGRKHDFGTSWERSISVGCRSRIPFRTKCSILGFSIIWVFNLFMHVFTHTKQQCAVWLSFHVNNAHFSSIFSSFAKTSDPRTGQNMLLYPLSQNGCYTHGPSHKPRMHLRIFVAGLLSERCVFRKHDAYAKRGRERYPLESGLANAQGHDLKAYAWQPGAGQAILAPCWPCWQRLWADGVGRVGRDSPRKPRKGYVEPRHA